MTTPSLEPMTMPTPIESFLLHFHARHPGHSHRVIGRAPLAGFDSPYERIAGVAVSALRAASAPPDGLLVELACGDGYLLERILREGIPPARCVGVDMSDAELGAARARPALAGVPLLCERAQELSLASNSAACMVSHGSFNVMCDLEQVVAEVARVLRPGGLLVWTMLDGPWPGSPNAFPLFLRLFDATHDRATRDVPVLADRRTRTRTGIESLFCPRTGFEELTIEEAEVSLDDSPEGVWSRLRWFYEMATWTEAEVEDTRARFLAAADSMRQADGTIPCRMIHRQVSCRRAHGELRP